MVGCLLICGISNVNCSSDLCSLTEIKMLETIAVDETTTEFIKYGDWVSIEMRDPQGQPIFCEIK